MSKLKNLAALAFVIAIYIAIAVFVTAPLWAGYTPPYAYAH